jgi:hypothetical protein
MEKIVSINVRNKFGKKLRRFMRFVRFKKLGIFKMFKRFNEFKRLEQFTLRFFSFEQFV